MKRFKGCLNKDCVSNENRYKYDIKYMYCPICGEKLKYVCSNKKCYNFLHEPLHIYCDDCINRKSEKKKNMKNNINETIKNHEDIIKFSEGIISITPTLIKAISKIIKK